MDTEEFVDKLDYEGGAYELYEYGVREAVDLADVDEFVRKAWRRFEDAMEEASYYHAALNEAIREWEDEQV